MPEERENLENRSDAWLIISEMSRQKEASDKQNDDKYNKMLKTFKQIIFALIIAWVASMAGIVYYFSNTEIAYETYDFDTKDGGNANYIGNDGDVYN